MRNYSSITDRKIRLALIGCGRIANNHFSSIETHANSVELVDVCDVNEAALAQAVARTQAQGHRSLTDLLKTTTADMVVLTTPSGLHPEQTIQIAQAGLHVMTEKPMATRWHDGMPMCACLWSIKTAAMPPCKCLKMRLSKVGLEKFTPLP
jgi:UDP-N-acetyl-2-amino-2-deoxyglucuronate dehydrogenase